jgi:hypothetical protein
VQAERRTEDSHVERSTMANGGALICPWEGVEGELGLGGDGGGGEEHGDLILRVEELGLAIVARAVPDGK